MFIYADTSAILALLVAGPGTALAVRAWDRAAAVACGRLSDVELVAALTRAVHDGELDAAGGVNALAAWRRYRGGVRRVEVTAAVTELAADIALEQELSTTAAIHLASALACAGRLGPAMNAPPPGSCRFLTMDPQLARAARAMELPTLTPPALADGVPR